jgi:simple sugar transport system permease protein
VLNIGAEGQLLLGAAAAVAVALAVPAGGKLFPLAIVAALLAAALAGAMWAGVAAYLRARYHVLEVISTIMLNFIALHVVSYLIRGPLQEPTHVYPQSATIADALHLPHLPAAGRLHAGLRARARAGHRGRMDASPHGRRLPDRSHRRESFRRGQRGWNRRTRDDRACVSA